MGGIWWIVIWLWVYVLVVDLKIVKLMCKMGIIKVERESKNKKKTNYINCWRFE